MATDRDKAGRPVVVVTGMGIVTSLGSGKTDNWDKLVAGQSGIRAITRFSTEGLKTRIAGTVDFVPVDPLTSPALASRLADMAAEENKYFVEAYRKRTNKDPDQNAAWAYTGMLLLAHAIHDAGPGADRAKVRDAMTKLTNIDTPLGAGKFSYDQDRMPLFDLIMLHAPEASVFCLVA